MHRIFGLSYQKSSVFPSGREQLRHARAAGFLAVELTLDAAGEALQLVKEARREGMMDVTLRLPPDPSGAIWREDTDEVALYSSYGGVLSAVARAGVSVLCLAPAVGTPPAVRQFALERIARICRMAERASVRLAFENAGAGEHFTYIVRSFCRGFHGVCFRPYDAFLANGTTALPPEVKGHLLALAMTDGRKGHEGLLPFDGEASLLPLAESLAEIPYRGALSLRPSGGAYAAYGYDGFAARAYDAARRFGGLCDDAEGVI